PPPPARHRARRRREPRREGAPLVFGPEADPQVGLLGPQGEAGEETGPDEVAPAPEHRGDLHAGPVAEGLVELGGGPGAAALEGAARLAGGAEAAERSRARLHADAPAGRLRGSDTARCGGGLRGRTWARR